MWAEDRVAWKLLMTGSSISQMEVSMRNGQGTLAAVAGFALLIGSLAFASPASAQTAAHKLGRGFAAVTTGFLEFPGNTYVETERRGAVGVPIGMAKGAGMIVARELMGVYEIVSAPFPAPSGFRPPLMPEYPWDYFGEGSHDRRTGERSDRMRG